METTCREFSKKGRKRIARRRTGFSHNCSTVRRVQRNNKKRGGILYKFLCMEGIIERTVKLQCDRRTHWVSSLQTLPLPPSCERGGKGRGEGRKGRDVLLIREISPSGFFVPTRWEKKKNTQHRLVCGGFFSLLNWVGGQLRGWLPSLSVSFFLEIWATLVVKEYRFLGPKHECGMLCSMEGKIICVIPDSAQVGRPNGAKGLCKESSLDTWSDCGL